MPRLSLLELAKSPHDRSIEDAASQTVSANKRSTSLPNMVAKWFFSEPRILAQRVSTTVLGWRRIAGTTVYANVTTGDSPEEYFADYFRTPSEVSIVTGDASLRVPMIPLLLTPHDWQVLDGNLPEPMISTRYARQDSCMGLCRKYYYLLSPPSRSEGGREQAQRDRRGMPAAHWFAAKTNDGRLVGIATAFIDGENICSVDGFIQKRFNDSYDALIGAAITWGEKRNSVRFATRLSVEDEEKRANFEKLGFRVGALDGTFAVGDRDVPAQTMLLN